MAARAPANQTNRYEAAIIREYWNVYKALLTFHEDVERRYFPRDTFNHGRLGSNARVNKPQFSKEFRYLDRKLGTWVANSIPGLSDVIIQAEIIADEFAHHNIFNDKYYYKTGLVRHLEPKLKKLERNLKTVLQNTVKKAREEFCKPRHAFTHFKSLRATGLTTNAARNAVYKAGLL